MTYLKKIAAGMLLGAITGTCSAHESTACIGSITYRDAKATLDLRIGMGLLDKITDLNDDASVSRDEWNTASGALKTWFLTGIAVRWGENVARPQVKELTMTDGSEVKLIAEFDLTGASPKIGLTLPILKKIKGVPPASIAVWQGDKMITPPQLLFYGREVAIDRTTNTSSVDVLPPSLTRQLSAGMITPADRTGTTTASQTATTNTTVAQAPATTSTAP